MQDIQIDTIIKELNLDTHIGLDKIPNIDLYMDQVITLFEGELAHTKRDKEDKLLTKTMINNYTKDKVLMPAKKKKYTRNHLIMMSLLYELKHTVSIGDIKKVFTLLQDEEKTIDTERLVAIYQSYLTGTEKDQEIFKTSIEQIREDIKDRIKENKLGGNEDTEKLLYLLRLGVQAMYYKKLLERLIDEWGLSQNV